MSKMKSSSCHGVKPGVAQKTIKDKPYQSRNLMGTNPLKEQYEPTDAHAIQQHHRMAGEE